METLEQDLREYVWGLVWVLGPNQSSVSMAISIGVDGIVFLWGPISLHRNFIETEKGLIVPVEPSTICRQGEIECHFTNQTPCNLHEEPLSPESRLLISSRALRENPNCGTTVQDAERCVADALQPPGTYRAAYVPDGITASITAGRYATMTIGKTWKKREGRTYKDSIVGRLQFETTDMMPYLRLRVGLEVSLCTGNARRTTLWDTLCLAFANVPCSHPIGDVVCVNHCLNKLANINSPLGAVQLPTREKVLHAVKLLAETGVRDDTFLRVWWPHGQVDLVYVVKATWVQMLEDTDLTSAWAVGSLQCLECEMDKNSHQEVSRRREESYGTFNKYSRRQGPICRSPYLVRKHSYGREKDFGHRGQGGRGRCDNTGAREANRDCPKKTRITWST